MRYKILTACMILLLVVPAFALKNDKGDSGKDFSASVDVTSWIDANNILMFVTNFGSFAYDNSTYFGKADGLYFPYSGLDAIEAGEQTSTVIYAGSVWMGGVVAYAEAGAPASVGDTLVTAGPHDTDWGIGPIVDGACIPGAQTNPIYRVYKIYSDSLWDNPNYDYLDWPVDQGAPVETVDIDGVPTEVPEMIGDQMCWSVYNDLDASVHTLPQGTTGKGLGVEVRQTAFAFDYQGPLGNIVFMRFRVYNKGPYDLTGVYLSVWADPDLGDAGDDLVGCDTTLSLGYCYNGDSYDDIYKSYAPAVGYDFFQGPLLYTGDDADTARMWGITHPGYTNLGLSSYNIYINPYDPDNALESYRFLSGLQKDGSPIIVQGTTPPETTMYFGSGDPTTGQGFLDNDPGDRRYMQNTGPFDMDRGDSTEILVAIIVGQGSSNLKSITELKSTDYFAQQVFERNFQLPKAPAKPDVTVTNLDNEIILEWGTASEDDPGDYPFEGYAVIQGDSRNGPWTDTLAWYDILNGTKVIYDNYYNSDAETYLPYVAKPGKDEGLRHVYRTIRDVRSGGELINYKNYYFKVEAYSFDTLQASGWKTLTSDSICTVMPQQQLTGTNIIAEYGDTLAVTHSTLGGAAPSPGWAEVYVIDPADINGHDYMITFSVDDELGNVWHVIDVTTEDTVVHNWVNQSNVTGEEDYPLFDGLMAKVYGPPPSIEEFQCVANGAGELDPIEAGAFYWADFPVPTTEANPDGEITENQQVGDGLWGIHTSDDGGTSGGGTRASYDVFLARVTRDGGNLPAMGGYDYEWRFTGDNTNPGVNGGYACDVFYDGNAFWVPFELWNTGIGTPDDPSDDVQLFPLILDDSEEWSGDNMFSLESYGAFGTTCSGYCEHSVSGGDNDPFTDLIYWTNPLDMTPGDAGYQAVKTECVDNGDIDAGYALLGDEIFARMVLVNWNGGEEPPFNQDLPEQGTVFRIVTAKPNTPNDIYTFTSAGYEPTVVQTGPEYLLDNIKSVPNPYYLYSEYDASTFNRRLKFINLPARCTISIYNLSGDLVKTVEKENLTATEVYWNLLNSYGVPVGSGIYIYVVDAPDFGQKIGKMAIFTEKEILEDY